ncbi:TatD family hydrolase [symbiont of Argiope bruennichi]|uniref:TatD family hydrolase n=1 Tax=symbiont of Argiope bruennichi TaxID=2810479 RepID=UPI003DA3BC0D
MESYLGIFDSHVHLNDEKYTNAGITVKSYIEENVSAGVFYFLNVCCHLSEAEKLIDSTLKYDHLYCSVGIHPLYVEQKFTDEARNRIKSFLSNEKVVAIGETGLDYYYKKDEKTKKVQIDSFVNHIKLAQEFQKPLIIHCREAFREVYQTLAKFDGSITGVIHCFTGNLEYAKKFVGLGFYISFAGQITFKNTKDLQDVVKQIPLEKILIETDGPYLSPHPYRGLLNKSKYLKETIKKIAELKQIPSQEVIKITTLNAKKLFKI